MKQIEYLGNTVNLIYNKNAKCWVSKIEIEGNEIELEIDMELFNQDKIDWENFEQFLIYISKKNRLSEYVKTGINPIKEIGLAFFKNCIDEIKEWKMQFSNSIIFRGYPKIINGKEDFEFSLVYDFAETKENVHIDGDAYALYLVNINSREGINGARRIQC